jgi:hypothetical protein
MSLKMSERKEEDKSPRKKEKGFHREEEIAKNRWMDADWPSSEIAVWSGKQNEWHRVIQIYWCPH